MMFVIFSEWFIWGIIKQCTHSHSLPSTPTHPQQFLSTFSKEFFNFWVFQLSSTFANFKNIWAILKNLPRETKNSNFDICKILFRTNLKPKTLDLVFNRAREINRTIIQLVQKGAQYDFFIYLTLCIMHMHIITIHHHTNHNLVGNHTVSDLQFSQITI